MGTNAVVPVDPHALNNETSENDMPFDSSPLASPAVLKPLPDDFVSIDMETRGSRNLRNVGVFNYTEDRHFSILCMGIAYGREPSIYSWQVGQRCPDRLARHIERGGMLHAWNAQFERVAWRAGFNGWPQPKREQWRCTMVRGLAAGVPGALEHAAPAMKVPERKDMEGSKIMRKLTKPRKMLADGTPIWWDTHRDYEMWFAQMVRYCLQDVRVERAIGFKLPYLAASEERQYWYDQRVADRGVPLDQDLCRAAIRIANTRKAEVDAECKRLTGCGPGQVAQLRAWTASKGCPIDDLKKETVAKAIADKATPKVVREALVCRQEGSRTNTKKFSKALEYVTISGRLKGMRQFYGAHTGRWAGRGVQLDNLMRPTMKNIPAIVDAVKTGESWYVESVYDKVMEPVANSVRSIIKAADGHELHVGDYKSIESRMLAFTSGQQSTLDQWRASDAGLGADVYVMNAADMFGCSLKEAAKKELRFWGKTAELSLGYEGGTGALLRSTEKNNVRFGDIYTTMFKNADDEMRVKVSRLWKLRGTGNERDWRAARFVVERWRKKNFMSVRLWYNLKDASVKAVANPGQLVNVRGLVFRFDKAMGMLFCKLLSGRELCYPFARNVSAMSVKGEVELQLRASHYSDKAHAFVNYHPYGGLLTENIVQAQSRDAMASTFERLERNCYKVIHTIHDEIITMSRIGLGSVAEFARLATVLPPWLKGFPLAIDPWSGPFYLKHD